MKLLRYARIEKPHTESDLERRVKKLILIAKALASEIETLQAELRSDGKLNQFDFNKHGIDFYHEVERYEIDLIRSALDLCDSNQAQASKLLSMKPTTLNAKMKHYRLNPVRRITT